MVQEDHWLCGCVAQQHWTDFEYDALTKFCLVPAGPIRSLQLPCLQLLPLQFDGKGHQT
jgi:hypothetical protein